MRLQGSKKLLGKVSVVLLVLMMPSCAMFDGVFDSTAEGEDPNNVKGAVVFFSEREPGGNAHDTRMFVNKNVMYISDPGSNESFILFNRKSKTIYNVNSADKTIMVIESRPVTIQPPIDIDYQEVSQPSGAIPKVSGKQATHYRYNANGKQCYDAVTLGKDFMPEVGMAIAEFRQVLAGEHAKTVLRTPKDLLNACDLALNIFHPAKHVQNGFPLREWDQKGYSRFLVNYRTDGVVKKQDLELPSDYERYSVP